MLKAGDKQVRATRLTYGRRYRQFVKWRKLNIHSNVRRVF